MSFRRPTPERRSGPPPQTPEERREKLLEMLRENPEAKYAMLSDMLTEPGFVIVAVAIRGVATADILIPQAKYDGTKIIDLVERYGSVVH